MENNNYVLNTITKIIGVLSSSNYKEKRYYNDIQWFQNKKELIDKNIIRIAIIGITSSGKSTLVNSILGEKLLPVSIKPSSSIIITCSKSEKREAIVYFEDGKNKVLEGESLNYISIGKYSDESKNPNNKYKVIQIDIKTPNFLLGDNIQIIDSPGLDAWNLEIHEKLTLEILLPTIDICVFLTTVKANSDKTNVSKIKMVNEKGKEILLVQNMIDSVEEKIGKNGIVEEDKHSILRKHRKRAENLLTNSINNKKKFEIVQISALYGINGIIEKNLELYEKSKLNELKKAIENCIMKIVPELNCNRIISINKRINGIIDIDSEIIGKNREYVRFLNEVKIEDVKELSENFIRSKNMILDKINKIDNSIEDTINNIKKSEEEAVENYLNIIDQINIKNLYIESEIFNLVKECESKKINLYMKLNLDVRFSYSLPSLESRQIQIKHKYEKRTKITKKNGNLNKGKRFLSDIFNTDWGYEKKLYDEKIVDKNATIENIREICYENKNKYIEILVNWVEQYEKALNLFCKEIKEREKTYNKKKNQNIEILQIEDVISKLSLIKNKFNLLDEVKEEVLITKDYEETTYTKYINYSLSNNSYNVYRLTNEIFEKNYKLVGKYIKNKNKERKIIFWTWDLDGCINFLEKIFNIYINESEHKKIKENGYYDFNDIIIVYDQCKTVEDLELIINRFEAKILNIFVIFNGIQFGNSQKQFLKSDSLLNIIKSYKVTLNLVIDSLKEFINSNTIKELLIEINKFQQDLLAKFNIKNYEYTLVNSRNPIYNIALIECEEKEEFIISNYMEIKEILFKNPLSRGLEEKRTLEEILLYFLNKNKI